MLWSYYISTVWDDPEEKSSWRDPYVFCMEIERGLKENGYFVDKENMEIWVPEIFNKSECLDWLKIAIQKIFGDDSVELSEGNYEDFAGTNADSIACMISTDKMENKSGTVEKYVEDHPDEFKS